MTDRNVPHRTSRRAALLLRGAEALLAALVCSCAPSSAFVSSWQSPDVERLDIDGARVAAIVMLEGEAARRSAEDVLARELRARGADGVALHTILPDARPDNEAGVRAALAEAGVDGAVVMRPIDARRRVVSSPTLYASTAYSRFWGGFYGFAFSAPWTIGTGAGASPRSDVIVSVETLVYSLERNTLVWAGTSRTTNPSNVERLIERTAEQTARELERRGLIEG